MNWALRFLFLSLILHSGAARKDLESDPWSQASAPSRVFPDIHHEYDYPDYNEYQTTELYSTFADYAFWTETSTPESSDYDTTYIDYTDASDGMGGGGDRFDSKTVYACEHNELHISCEQGKVIQLIRAYYGRHSVSNCNDDGKVYWSGRNCMSSMSNSVVQDRCNQRRSCFITASNWEFGDPCIGTVKYLEVQYRCVLPSDTKLETTTTTTTTRTEKYIVQNANDRPASFFTSTTTELTAFNSTSTSLFDTAPDTKLETTTTTTTTATEKNMVQSVTKRPIKSTKEELAASATDIKLPPSLLLLTAIIYSLLLMLKTPVI